MAKICIYSTMSSDNKYAQHEKLPNGLHKKNESMFVNGKANVSNAKTLITPKGALTIVESELFEKVKDNSMLKRHIERGFIKIEKSKKEVDDVVKDMTKKDNSAQKTEEDFKPNKEK
jgi:rRNA maturation endonuclease Nob1